MRERQGQDLIPGRIYSESGRQALVKGAEEGQSHREVRTGKDQGCQRQKKLLSTGPGAGELVKGRRVNSLSFAGFPISAGTTQLHSCRAKAAKDDGWRNEWCCVPLIPPFPPPGDLSDLGTNSVSCVTRAGGQILCHERRLGSPTKSLPVEIDGGHNHGMWPANPNSRLLPETETWRDLEREYTSIASFTESYTEVPRLQGLRSQNQYFLPFLINSPKISQLARGSFWGLNLQQSNYESRHCLLDSTDSVNTKWNECPDGPFPSMLQSWAELSMATNSTVFSPLTLRPWMTDNLLGQPTLSLTTTCVGKISKIFQMSKLYPDRPCSDYRLWDLKLKQLPHSPSDAGHCLLLMPF